MASHHMADRRKSYGRIFESTEIRSLDEIAKDMCTVWYHLFTLQSIPLDDIEVEQFGWMGPETIISDPGICRKFMTAQTQIKIMSQKMGSHNWNLFFDDIEANDTIAENHIMRGDLGRAAKLVNEVSACINRIEADIPDHLEGRDAKIAKKVIAYIRDLITIINKTIDDIKRRKK